MSDRLAIYWDFENIHASIATVRFGQNWYRENRYSSQPILVEIKSIMEFVRSIGEVNINKSYGNWTYFNDYNIDLQDYSIDLIQMFHRGSHGKNGADIRMALDVLEDLSLFNQITTVIIIGGDSDYISLAQKVRQKGKKIIGIGVKETTNHFLVKSCNEFKYYSTLLIKSSTISNIEKEGFEESDVNDARELLCKSISRIVDQSQDNAAKKAAIKPMMMRLDPSFDETNFGFNNFNSFLDSCLDLIEITPAEHDHLVSIKKNKCKIDEGKEAESNQRILHPYERILKKQQIRLVEGKILKTAALETFTLFKKHNEFASYTDYQYALLDKLKKKFNYITEKDIKKIKAILYKSFIFRLNKVNSSIIISSEIKSGEELYDRVIKLITKRILDNIDGKPSIEDFSEIVLGDSSKKSLAQSYIDKYYTQNS